MVQHEGFIGLYSHLVTISPLLVENKTYVNAGENLGVIGRSGIIFGTHLYFEMILSGKPADPAPYLVVPLCGGVPHRTVAARTDSNGVEGS